MMKHHHKDDEKGCAPPFHNMLAKAEFSIFFFRVMDYNSEEKKSACKRNGVMRRKQGILDCRRVIIDLLLCLFLPEI